MGVWKIYHKDGTILKDANGNNIDIRSLEYSDAWMGECYLTVTFRHETPIVFMMGDYIIYRNEKFVLNYEPGKDKKARINTCGDGFVYDSVKFNSLQNELSDAEFLDVVLNDNELHYTALPKFQFYVETLDDLLDRIQANLNEQIGAGKWKIFSRNKDRSEQRGCTADEWNEAYGEGTNNNIIDSASITADTMTCWDALALVNSKWNVNFIVRGRNVYVGTAGVTTEHMFEYGRGNGLYEIEQNADSDQKVITRLRAYGSEKNLPSHYYADLGVKYFANITKVVEASTHVELELDLDYIETYFRNKRKYVVSGESQEQSFGWVLQVTFDFQTVITGYVTQVYNSNKCKFYSELMGTQTDTGDEESKEKLDAFIAQVNSGKTKMYITSGLNKKNVPSSMKEYAENLPNNMSINRLMLPGFPHVSLSDFYESLTDEEKKYVNPTGKQHRFSTDPHRPYIDSVNIGQIGLHSASQFFDTDDKTNGIIEIYPTIEEMVIGGVRVDEIDEGVAPDDDGRYDGDHGPNNVDIYLSRAIDFDIKDLADDDFSISMKDGRCGGRTFKVSSSTKVDGRWRLTIERTKDDALDLWFPYRDYYIRKGDHFVLTGITLPDSYVNAASLKLLKYAIALLEKNDYTRYVYQPKVDEIFMARQHDSAMADKTGAIKSLHDTLKAGDLMDFRDDDLNISGTITIDQLNIKEQDGKIPTYEITLREDKEVGTIQKIQQQITSLENGNGGSVGGGGITLTQVKGQVATEGSKFFLSKLTDDTAEGLITFAKGLIAKALVDLEMGAKFGNNAMVTKLGEAFFSTIKSLDYDNAAEQGFSVEKEKNGKYHAFFTNLTIWGKAMFHELEVRKLSYSGGNIYLSGAGSKLIKVVPVKKSVSADGVTSWVETTEEDVERFGWKCYLLADNGTTATMNYWQEGDQARCQTMGEIVSGGTYQNASNKSYWRTIPNGGVSTQNEKIYGTKKETYIDDDGNEQTREVQVELYDGQAFAWIVISKHCDDIDGYDDEFSVGYDGTNPAPLETRDIPSAGDTIVLDGNRHRNKQGEYDKTDRQNVIILETTGEYAPRIACYANITEYKHTFTKSVNGSNKEVSLSVFETSPKGGTKINSSRFEWISDDGSTINIINYRGDWVSDNTYHKNDQVNHNNAVWVCVANSGVDVQEEPSDVATYWKKVLSGGKGEKGDDGKTPQPTGSAELYYAITSSPFKEPDDSSWTITPIDTSKYQGKFLWTDNRTEWKIGDKTEWISNKTCSYIGKDGANGTSVSIKGSLSDIGELPTSGNVNGDSYLIDGYLWIYTGTSVDDNNHHNGFENVGKIKGEDGISATQYYYHVAWMNTSDNSDNSFTTTNPSGSSYAYIGTLIDTTENDSDDYTKYDWAYVKGDRGEDGKNAVRLDLTNESSTVTCDKDGNIIGTIQGTVAILYDGAKEADINMVSYSISSYKGLSSMPTISEGGVISDLSVSGGKTSLEASINIKAVYKNHDYYATYTITKVLAGSDGTPATTYWIEPSATAIKVDSDGNSNPSTITCKQYKQVGAESPVAGDKKIYYRHNAIDSTLWNEYTEAIIPATNVEAYEFVLADKTPSISSAIIYDRESITVVKDGQNGNDAMLFRLYLSKSSVNYATDSGINNIYVYVMQTIGGKNSRTPIANMQKLCKAKFYVEYVNKDGSVIKEYRDGTTGIINSDSRFDTLAYAQLAPTKFYIDLVSADDDSIVIDTKEVIVVKDGEQGESALEIIVTPETLAFDTNDYGVVPHETSKQASISCYRNGLEVTNVSYSISAEENCLASVSESNGSATVTISKITSQEVADDSGNSSTISNTSGYATIQVWDKDTNLYHRVQVKFMVNVAKFTGQMVNTNKQFSKTLTEVGNRVDDKVGSSELKQFKAEITQTAREISLSVSEKSIGRRNMLVGSAFLREDNNRIISNDARIEINSGYQGTNCIHVIDATEAGNPHYVGVYWDGSQGGRSIKIEKGKKYTMSCFYKTNNINTEFYLEAIYTDKQENATRKGQAKYLSTNGHTVKKVNEWELFTTVVDTTDAEYDYIAFNFWEACTVAAGQIEAWICRPMVEEGDKYNGWTLSQDDYDIIGANLIDNSRTLQVGGNILSVTGNKTLVGDVYELTASGSNDYNPLYRIKGDAFKLNTDYTLSFEVRGDAKYLQVNAFYPANNTKYTYYREQQNDLMYETEGDGTTVAYAILGEFEVLSKQQKVWVHFRFKDRLPEQIYFQFTKNSEQTGVTSWSVTITRPKIEVGAVVTEYTERKSDLVDKASLKKAGIEVKSDEVLLYGDRIRVDNNGQTAAMFIGGKLNADFIDADKIEVKHLWAKSEDGTVKVGYFGNTEESACKINDNTFAPLFVGGVTAKDSPFYVTSEGAMHATSGYIGGFTILSNQLHSDGSGYSFDIYNDRLAYTDNTNQRTLLISSDSDDGLQLSLTAAEEKMSCKLMVGKQDGVGNVIGLLTAKTRYEGRYTQNGLRFGRILGGHYVDVWVTNGSTGRIVTPTAGIVCYINETYDETTLILKGLPTQKPTSGSVGEIYVENGILKMFTGKF